MKVCLLLALVAALAAPSVAVMVNQEDAVAELREVGESSEDDREAALEKVQRLIGQSPDSDGDDNKMDASVATKKRMELLEDEVSTLKAEQHTIRQQTALDLRASLNKSKESYFKKMKKAGSFRVQLGQVAARAAKKISTMNEEVGKYKAINKVLETKAAYGVSLQNTVENMSRKMVGAIKATHMLVKKSDKDDKEIQKLKLQLAEGKGKAGPAGKGELKPEKEYKGCDESLPAKERIACEKKMAARAHNKAAKASHQVASEHHATAATHHKKEGADDAAADAEKEAATSSDKADAVDAEEADKDEAKKDESGAKKAMKNAKKQEKKAKKLQEKANKAKKAAKKVKAAKKEAKEAKKEETKAAEKAEDAKEKEKDAEAGGDNDELGDDDSDSDDDADSDADDDSDDMKKSMGQYLDMSDEEMDSMIQVASDVVSKVLGA